MFGKDRSRYVAADVMSDDEDMEAGASDLEREELRRSVPHSISAPLPVITSVYSVIFSAHMFTVHALLAKKTSWLWKKKGVTKKRNDANVRRRSESSDTDRVHRRSVLQAPRLSVNLLLAY